MESIFFRMENINKYYHMGDEDMQVLRDVNLEIREGEFLSVLGPSGSGKSTLMNIIGCLDTATSGSYILGGQLIEDMTEGELADLRSQAVGFVFQNSQLLPRLGRAAKCGAASDLCRRQPAGADPPGEGNAGPGRSFRPDGPLSQLAFRRPAAAGRHRESSGDQSPDSAGG